MAPTMRRWQQVAAYLARPPGLERSPR